ncbi:MAG: 4Fe-4S binding protein [Lachnospiraceae bacterium]|nr:4Fe-4S binding protein [Lachnospiraceae bacterium]
MPTNIQKTRKILGPCAIAFTASNTGSWRLQRPSVDELVCVRCKACARICPVDCITVHTENSPVEFDWRYCKGCGICANECPKKRRSGW